MGEALSALLTSLANHPMSYSRSGSLGPVDLLEDLAL